MMNQGGTMTYQGKFATLITVLLATACAALMPTRAQAQCTATTIAGNWGTRESVLFDAKPNTSLSKSAGSLVPVAAAGRIVFTANSATSGTFAWHQVGNSGGAPFVFDLTGTYSVDSGTCTGTITRTDGVEIFFVVVQGATEIDFSFLTSQNPQTTGQRVGQGVMKKQ
jgi:hypothetical protein